MNLIDMHIEWKNLFRKQPMRRLPTKARPEGTVITCGKCKKPTRVYHFAWSAIRCPDCHTDGNKQDWRFDADNQSIDAKSAPTYIIGG
jgi:uncharacterized CHY-type Zn-finger protein